MLKDAGVGLMNQPNIGNSAESIRGWTWAADNGCFGSNWDAEKWVAYLERRTGEPGCLFAVVPDVVGDHMATVERWHQWWRIVADLGYRPAFVLQNGCTVGSVPWGECEAVFIGGDDTYKLSDHVRTIVAEARRRGVWVHMGRVNSYRRLRIARDMGCDSVDGTYLAYGPDVNTPKLVGWLKSLWTNPSLFEVPPAGTPIARVVGANVMPHRLADGGSGLLPAHYSSSALAIDTDEYPPECDSCGRRLPCRHCFIGGRDDY